MNIGEKIRKVRELKGISIKEVAERSNLSPEQVQSIEENKNTPSLAPLIKIARALAVRLGTFLDDQEYLGPVISRASEKKATVSFSNDKSHTHTNIELVSLANNKAGRHMEPLMVDVMPYKEDIGITSTHEGEEFLYVMEGQIMLTYGKEAIILNQGDSIYYDSIIPHKIVSADCKIAKLLAVVYTPI